MFLVEKAISYYRTQLKLSPTAIQYLKDRGISSKVVNEFQIGYAPSNPEYGYSYHDRIMIPIRNNWGEFVAFTGRTIISDSPKYLNSWESPEYQKYRLLFGYYESLSHIINSGEAILVEGQFDLLTLWQNGVKNVVASSGKFTPEQARVLSRYTTKVIIAMDNDSAGDKIAIKAKRYLEDMEVTTTVLKLPVKDPDEYIRAEGIDKFKELCL